MDGVRRFTGLVLGPCLTLVAVDGCAGGARRDCGLCEAQPQLNLAVGRLLHQHDVAQGKCNESNKATPRRCTCGNVLACALLGSSA